MSTTDRRAAAEARTRDAIGREEDARRRRRDAETVERRRAAVQRVAARIAGEPKAETGGTPEPDDVAAMRARLYPKGDTEPTEGTSSVELRRRAIESAADDDTDPAALTVEEMREHLAERRK